MKSVTDEFCFLLKPSKYGVGVFAVHGIKKGTFLRLFGDEKKLSDRSIERKRKTIPKIFQQYCIIQGDWVISPRNFSHMTVGWYLNHSVKPNAVRDKSYHWYALRNIKKDEEITIDYNSLEEPEIFKEAYYRK